MCPKCVHGTQMEELLGSSIDHKNIERKSYFLAPRFGYSLFDRRECLPDQQTQSGQILLGKEERRRQAQANGIRTNVENVGAGFFSAIAETGCSQSRHNK
jgi:hypothetical protein